MPHGGIQPRLSAGDIKHSLQPQVQEYNPDRINKTKYKHSVTLSAYTIAPNGTQ